MTTLTRADGKMPTEEDYIAAFGHFDRAAQRREILRYLVDTILDHLGELDENVCSELLATHHIMRSQETNSHSLPESCQADLAT